MDTGPSIQERQLKAREILRSKKKELGISWAHFALVLGRQWPPSSLRVYAANSDFSPPLPDDLVDLLLDLDNVLCPLLDIAPQPDMALALVRGRWRIIPLPDFRECLYCGKLFVPHHPQQQYCDGYRGECGKAKRRERYGKRNSGDDR